MNNNNNKIYAKGSAKEIGQYGTIALSVNLEQLQSYANNDGYVKLLIQKKKEVDKYGNTHLAVVEQPVNR